MPRPWLTSQGTSHDLAPGRAAPSSFPLHWRRPLARLPLPCVTSRASSLPTTKEAGRGTREGGLFSSARSALQQLVVVGKVSAHDSTSWPHASDPARLASPGPLSSGPSFKKCLQLRCLLVCVTGKGGGRGNPVHRPISSPLFFFGPKSDKVAATRPPIPLPLLLCNSYVRRRNNPFSSSFLLLHLHRRSCSPLFFPFSPLLRFALPSPSLSFPPSPVLSQQSHPSMLNSPFSFLFLFSPVP